MMGMIRRLEVREQAIICQISGQLLCDKPFEQLRDDGQVGDWQVFESKEETLVLLAAFSL